MLRPALPLVFRLAENRMDRDTRYSEGVRRYTPMLEIKRPFFRRGEVTFARLVDPKSVRVEVGCHGHLRDADLLLLPQRCDHLRRQEVRVDDQVPGFRREELDELLQIEL